MDAEPDLDPDILRRMQRDPPEQPPEPEPPPRPPMPTPEYEALQQMLGEAYTREMMLRAEIVRMRRG